MRMHDDSIGEPIGTTRSRLVLRARPAARQMHLCIRCRRAACESLCRQDTYLRAMEGLALRYFVAVADRGRTMTVAVIPAASVISAGTLSILTRTGIRWAKRAHV
jgi:hypothetical protein